MHSDTISQILGGDWPAHASEFGCTSENTMCLSIDYQFHNPKAQEGRVWTDRKTEPERKAQWNSMNWTQSLCVRHSGAVGNHSLCLNHISLCL